MKMKKKQAFILIISFFLGVFLMLVYITLNFYIHEAGHILGSIISDILSGNPIHSVYISIWGSSPILGIPVPKRTHTEGDLSLFFVYGGIFTSIIIISLICLWIYTRFTTKKWILLFPVYIFTIE